jgi:AcrR family transcriptional regulator
MPKIVDREAYRREILEKCLHLFSRKGYAKVTMREIAAAVGVSTGTLYHYFPTKENIQESLFAHIMESNVGEYLRRVEKTDSVAERLQIIADFWKEHGDYYQQVMLVAIDSFRSDAANSNQDVFWAFSEYYTQAMGDRLGLTERCARDLFIHLLGLIFHAILTPDNLSFPKEIDHLEKTLAALILRGNNTAESGMACLEQLLADRSNRECVDDTD